MTHVITFPVAGDYLSLNDRRHWRDHSQLVAAWREAAYFGACSWRATPAARRLTGHCTIQFVFPVSTSRRRDPHNWYPTVKACIDGLVHANVFTDDSSEYVTTLEPVLIKGDLRRDLVIAVVKEEVISS